MDKVLNNELKRINIRVSARVKNYFECKSRDTGVAQSALMALALEEYIDQKTMLKFTETVNALNKENKL